MPSDIYLAYRHCFQSAPTCTSLVSDSFFFQLLSLAPTQIMTNKTENNPPTIPPITNRKYENGDRAYKTINSK
ncbi:hypothetical protein AX774_g5233 [Zancudomyces culisetae]|uniref:Uncharacterized protein n=1 Tax=Zancudomyces culisetae TaxID=1213189 RepID=A0A1R1PK20_ZANCU|nr:hypothetical protein AX774_g5233 [Zancudomyces culisetae]|eukprot:OMH81320.1 hypothetical protein AX774_g5233 [Zancudomyces culisetae]